MPIENPAMVQIRAVLHPILESMHGNIWPWQLAVVLTSILFTRALTQLQQTLRSSDTKAGTKDIQRQPYWLPFLGTSPQFLFHSQSWLQSLAKANNAGAFGLKLSGRDYIVVVLPSLQASLLEQSAHTSTRLHDDRRSRRFFNNPQVTSATSLRIQNALRTYTNDKSRIVKLTRVLEGETYNFISASRSWVDQAQWERAAGVTVLDEKPTLSVSANITTLIRNFASQVILSTLLGRSFVEANPSFVDDFFHFSSKHAMFMTGLPYWIAPGLGPPALAREKCLLCVDGLVNAIVAEIEGRSASRMGTTMLYDLEDVHPAIWELIKGVRKEGGKIRARVMACEILEMVWQIVFYKVNMVIWVLVYLFMESGGKGSGSVTALHDVREELHRLVDIVKPPPTGLPFEDPPRLKFTATESVGDKSPTISAVLLEVQRLETEYEDYFVVEADFILQASISGMQPDNRRQTNDKYQMKRGDHIYAAYGATYKDLQHWDRPRRFVPTRFLSEQENGMKVVSNKSLLMPRQAPFSDSKEEILCIVASILSFYDIGSLDESGGLHPGTKIVAGMGMVKKDVQGKVVRRAL